MRVHEELVAIGAALASRAAIRRRVKAHAPVLQFSQHLLVLGSFSLTRVSHSTSLLLPVVAHPPPGRLADLHHDAVGLQD